MRRLAFAFVLAATATASAQGTSSAPDAPSEPAAEPAAPADPTAPPATSPPQGLPAYPENPRIYAPPPAPRADPGRVTVDSGASVTGSGGWIHGAWMLEAGFTIPKLVPSPYFVRARAALMLTGGTIQSDWSGSYTRYAIGGEAGVCGSFVCGFADLDLAYQHADLHDDFDRLEGDRKGPHIYGRAGIDLGPRRIHVRAALEVGRWKTHHTPSEWLGTGGFFLALGLRL